MPIHNLSNLQKGVEYIRKNLSQKPAYGLVLGSGLGSLVKEINISFSVQLKDLPFLSGVESQNQDPQPPAPTGVFSVGQLNDKCVAILQDRSHYYETGSMHQVVLPVRLMALLGVQTLILTNSSGALNPKMQPGDFLLIEDHINLMGSNPLMGPNVKELGPRFPDLSQVYDERLLSLMQEIVSTLEYRHHRGVYAAVSGPTFETRAEVRYLRMIGASAVGMSLVPEVIAAAHLGMRIAAISCITSVAKDTTPDTSRKLSAEEMAWTARRVESQFSRFVQCLLERI